MSNSRGSKFNSDELEERIAKFAERVIDLCKKLPKNTINQRLIPQSIGASSSSLFNYSEACEAESKKDFKHKIGIVNKELRETKSWLRFLARANQEFINEFRVLWQEAHELKLIFSKIKNSCK